MPRFLPYGRQSVDDDDLAAVAAVLKSDWLTTGPKVEEFEQAFAARVGAAHAVAVNSGTAALHLVMLAAGIGPGRRVLTSPNTFLASANCAAMVGADPDFADVDPITHGLDPGAVEQAWQADVAAVVAVDYAGQACDMPELARIARSHGAFLVEDACHSVGGAFLHDGRRWSIGGHPWADATVFSFHPVKSLTSGEGGMIATNDVRLANKCRRLRSHGVVREASQFAADGPPLLEEHGPWYYEMHDLGYNYRLPDILCALGRSQLARLDVFLARRREIVARYNEAFAKLAWLTTPGLRNAADRDLTAWHLYTVEIDFDQLGRTRTEVMQVLRRRDVGSQVLYIPVHLQPWYRRTYGYTEGKCPIAERIYRRALSLPLYPAMDDADVARVIEAVFALDERGGR
jgi:perosamine synthetase